MRGAREISTIKVKLKDKEDIICPVQGIWMTEYEELFLKVETSPGITVNYRIGKICSDCVEIQKT